MFNINKLLVVFLTLFVIFTIALSKEQLSKEDLENLKEIMDNPEKFPQEMESLENDSEEQINELVVKMGLDKQETIDRNTFTQFFTKLVLQEEEVPADEKQIFDKLINRVVMNAPEIFPTSDIKKYVDMHFISSVLNEIMIEAGIDPNAAMGDFGDMGGEHEDHDHDHDDHDHDHSDLNDSHKEDM
jgi:hypothetical protein